MTWDWEEVGPGVRMDPEILFQDGVKLEVRGQKSKDRVIFSFEVHLWPWEGRSKVKV